MILMLAGTSDARMLAIRMKEVGYNILTTVVTESAEAEMKRSGIDVLTGRLTDVEMMSLIKAKGVQAVVDASHPFAEEASKNAISAAKQAEVPYIRYERESQTFAYEKMSVVDDYEEAASLAATKKGVVMLTTGSKTLQVFTKKLLEVPDIRLIARMLPIAENMEKCTKLGLLQKNIIAIQGPFTKEFDQALYKQYGVNVMVTKESGKVGSVDQKVEAAKELGIEIIMIRRPRIDYGHVYSQFSDVIQAISEILPLTAEKEKIIR
ncbi:precorrin-6A reductase [Niallia sp. 01092]|uniref:precorrin-6A reductase n=1 Tax=unclassified Niallia TaxID=2837522 RepID=UPI003FCFDB07